MAQQETDLPEGTDEVIQGAMDTDTSDVTGGRGSRGGGARSGPRKSSTGNTAGTALMELVRSGGE